jgi:hypothetical protein
MATRTHEIDAIAVNEAILIIKNDHQSYIALMKTYLPNLEKKFFKGQYDKEKAIKLMESFYQNVARKRLKSRDYGWDPKFNPAERKAFATYFRDFLHNEFIKKLEIYKPKKPRTLSEQLKLEFKKPKQKGWHKDHNNYNKAEKWERTPAKRKTPARNVVKKSTVLSQKPLTRIIKYKKK